MPDNKELSFSADCNDNQDTQQRSNIDDYHERRRMQNRIAQRKYRERNKKEGKRGKSRNDHPPHGPSQTPELVALPVEDCADLPHPNPTPAGTSMRQSVSSLAPLMPFTPTYSSPQNGQKPAMANEQQENLFPLYYSSTATDSQQQYMALDHSFKGYHIGAPISFDYASSAQDVQFSPFRDAHVERSLHLPDPTADPDASGWLAQSNLPSNFRHVHHQSQTAKQEQSKYDRSQNAKPHEQEGMNSSKDDRRGLPHRPRSKRTRPTEPVVHRNSHAGPRKRALTGTIEDCHIDKALLIQLKNQLGIEKKPEEKSKQRTRNASSKNTRRASKTKGKPWKSAEFKTVLLEWNILIERRALRAVERWRQWHDFGVTAGLFEFDPTYSGDIQMILSRLRSSLGTVAHGKDTNEYADTPPNDAEDYDSLDDSLDDSQDDSSEWDRDHGDAYNGYEEDDDSGSKKDSDSEQEDESERR